MSYSGEPNTPSKISKFVETIGVISRAFKPSLVQPHTKLKIYRTLARPVPTYGSEAWTISQMKRDTKEMRK
jgi:hypothetical protein